MSKPLQNIPDMALRSNDNLSNVGPANYDCDNKLPPTDLFITGSKNTKNQKKFGPKPIHGIGVLFDISSKGNIIIIPIKGTKYYDKFMDINGEWKVLQHNIYVEQYDNYKIFVGPNFEKISMYQIISFNFNPLTMEILDICSKKYDWKRAFDKFWSNKYKLKEDWCNINYFFYAEIKKESIKYWCKNPKLWDKTGKITIIKKDIKQIGIVKKKYQTHGINHLPVLFGPTNKNIHFGTNGVMLSAMYKPSKNIKIRFNLVEN